MNSAVKNSNLDIIAAKKDFLEITGYNIKLYPMDSEAMLTDMRRDDAHFISFDLMTTSGKEVTLTEGKMPEGIIIRELQKQYNIYSGDFKCVLAKGQFEEALVPHKHLINLAAIAIAMCSDEALICGDAFDFRQSLTSLNVEHQPSTTRETKIANLYFVQVLAEGTIPNNQLNTLKVFDEPQLHRLPQRRVSEHSNESNRTPRLISREERRRFGSQPTEPQKLPFSNREDSRVMRFGQSDQFGSLPSLDQTIETAQYLTEVAGDLNGYVNSALSSNHDILALDTINVALNQTSQNLSTFITAIRAYKQLEALLRNSAPSKSEVSRDVTKVTEDTEVDLCVEAHEDATRLLDKMVSIIRDDLIPVDSKLDIATMLIRIDDIARSEQVCEERIAVVCYELLTRSLAISVICTKQRITQPIGESPNWWNRLINRLTFK